jgi:hypothetical protein
LDAARVRDRHGRTWTVTITTPEQDDDLAPWIDMSPEERLEVVGDCVLDGLRVRGKLDVPRFRRVLRITERAPRALPDRGRVRGGVSREAQGDEIHRRPRR